MQYVPACSREELCYENKMLMRIISSIKEVGKRNTVIRYIMVRNALLIRSSAYPYYVVWLLPFKRREKREEREAS